MEMKKKRIVYSLTGRGLFSELSNLALALVYADYNQEELTVNTRNWNARVEKGWSDYFESVLPNCNGVMCSQYIVYKKGKPWWGNIYYNRYFPTKVSPFYKQYIANTSPRYSLARPIRNNHSSLSLPLHSSSLY